MNALDNVLDQCHPELRARKVAFRWPNGVAYYGKNGRVSELLVGSGRLHVSENRGWRPISILPRRVNGEVRVPDLALRLGTSGEVYRGRKGPYVPRSVGVIHRGRYRKLHDIGAPLLTSDVIIRPAGPHMHFETVLTTDGFSDHLILEEIPDLDGDYLAFELAFRSRNCGKFLPFAVDAGGRQILCDTIQHGTSLLLGVPMAWLRRATPPVDIDPDITAVICWTQGSDLGSYAAARATADSVLASCSGGQRLGQLAPADAGLYAVARHNHKWFLTCTLGTISTLDMDLAASSKAETVVDFDVQIAKSDWHTESTAANPCSIGCTVCEVTYDKCVAATLDVVWRNTSAVVVDTYYTSPAMDVAYAQSNLDAYGFIFTCLRSAEDAANSAPVNNEAINIYCPGNASFKPILHLTGDFFDCTGADAMVIPEFGNWET